MSVVPQGWVLVTLGEVTAPRGDKADPSDLDDLPFIGLEEVEAHTGRIIRMQTTSGLKSAVALFGKDDLLYGRLRPYLNKVVLAEGSGAASAEFIILPPSEALEQSYLQRTLMSPDFVQFTGLRSTGDRPRVSFEGVSDYQFPLPPRPEQRRIVAKMDSLTGKSRRAREHLDHIPRLVEKYKQAVLVAAFSGRFRAMSVGYVDKVSEALDKLRREHRAQNTISAGSSPDALFPIPTHWCWATAETVVEPGAEIVYGIVQPGPKLTSGVRYVRGTDIENGRIKLDQLLFTSAEIASRYERASLRGGDVLLGIIRATKVAIVPEELTGGNITQGTARFRPSRLIRTSFLAYWLESRPAQSWLHSKYRGIDMPGLNLRDVRRLPVPLPPIEEQQFIETGIQRAFTWIDRLASEATSAHRLINRLDQAVLAKAFRGELVPQDAEDEPASLLLDRIKAERGAAPQAKRGRKAK